MQNTSGAARRTAYKGIVSICPGTGTATSRGQVESISCPAVGRSTLHGLVGYLFASPSYDGHETYELPMMATGLLGSQDALQGTHFDSSSTTSVAARL